MRLFIVNFKRRIKSALGIFLGCLTVLLCFPAVANLLAEPKKNLYCFYRLEKNSLDMINIGSSHVFSNINPVEIYDRSGIRSYNLAAGSQSIWYSYYYLLEALKTQTPRMVLLDVYTICELNDDSFIEKAENNLQAMKYSRNKWDALQASGMTKTGEAFLNFPISHNRYAQLEEMDYEMGDSDYVMGYKSALSGPSQVEFERYDVTGVKETVKITEKSELYLRKCIECCQERGIDIVLINAPWPNITEQDQKVYNYVREIAEEYNIDFLNGCLLENEIGIKWPDDMLDQAGHLNYWGGLKWSDYLADYLVKNYHMKREIDNADKVWNTNREMLGTWVVKSYLEEKNKLSDCTSLLRSCPQLIYCILIDGMDEIPDEARELLEELGVGQLNLERAFVLHMNDGSVLTMDGFSDDKERYLQIYKHLKRGTSVKNRNYLERQFTNVIEDAKEGKRITFIVFDPWRNELASVRGFHL